KVLAVTTSQQPDAPKPAAPKPGSVTPAEISPVAPVAPVPAYTSDLAEAKQFAQVSDNGDVTLLDGDEKSEVGQAPEASQEDDLSYYIRNHEDVMTQLQLLTKRLETDASKQESEKTLDQIDETIAKRQMVGDMATLREASQQLRDELAQRQAQHQAQREEAQAEQHAAREAIVEHAEQVASQDPAKTQWKQSTAKM